MKNAVRSTIFGALAMLFSGYAGAATITYKAVLLGSTETPATGSPATGSGTFTLNGDSLSINLTFSGLTGGAAAAAHIHCCVLPGVNAGVAVPFTGFPGVASGTYTATFDLTNVATYTSAFLTASGGTAASAESTLIAGMNAGLTYANIHDTTFPGGEIRGFLAAAGTPTPEPGTLYLSSILLVGILFSRSKFKIAALKK